MSTQSKIIKGIIYVFLTLLALVYLLPLLWVVITSLKDDAVLMISPWAMASWWKMCSTKKCSVA